MWTANRALLMCLVVVSLGNVPPVLAYEYRIELVQHVLVRLGYDPGGIDGKLAKRTENAIRSFQQDNDLPVNGTPDEATIDRPMTLGGDWVDPRKLTLKGVIAFINDKSAKCRQDNTFAVLPNKMARGLYLEVRGGEVRLNTRIEVIPYEVSANELSAVNHRRRFRIAPKLTDLEDLRVARGADSLMPSCYTIDINCLPEEDCVTEGGIYRRQATRAAFKADPDDIAALRAAWRRLFVALGAPEPDEFATFEVFQALPEGAADTSLP